MLLDPRLKRTRDRLTDRHNDLARSVLAIRMPQPIFDVAIFSKKPVNETVRKSTLFRSKNQACIVISSTEHKITLAPNGGTKHRSTVASVFLDQCTSTCVPCPKSTVG